MDPTMRGVTMDSRRLTIKIRSFILNILRDATRDRAIKHTRPTLSISYAAP